MATASQTKKQQRTAVIYFGSGRETYLSLVQAEDSSKFLSFIQQKTANATGSGKTPSRLLWQYSIHRTWQARALCARVVGRAGSRANLSSPLLLL